MICPTCGKDVRLVGRPAKRLRKHRMGGRGPGRKPLCLDSGAYEDDIEARTRGAHNGPKPASGPLSELLDANWLAQNPDERRRWYGLVTGLVTAGDPARRRARRSRGN